MSEDGENESQVAPQGIVTFEVGNPSVVKAKTTAEAIEAFRKERERTASIRKQVKAIKLSGSNSSAPVNSPKST